MNFIDIAILVILALFLVKGLLRGLLREICSLLGLLAGALLALRYHGPLAQTMAEAFRLPAGFCAAVTFALLFLAAVLVFWGVGYLLTRFVKLLFLGGLNRVVGGFFGLAQGVLLLAVILFAVANGGSPGFLLPSLERSHLAPPFLQLGEAAFRGGHRVLEEWR